LLPAWLSGRPESAITNAGGNRKLSSVAAGHIMQIKEKHYEKIVEDVEQMHESSHYFLIFSYPFKKKQIVHTILKSVYISSDFKFQ
jgi:hypothetical protein